MFEEKNMGSFWIEGTIGAIKALAFVCDIITYPVYLILHRPWEKKTLSRRIKAQPVGIEEKSITYRSLQDPREAHVQLLREGVDTMEKMLHYVAKLHKNKRCLGTREIIAEEDEIQPDKRVFKKYVMGEYKWKTFQEVEELAASFGRGLRLLGQVPRANVVIFAETRAEWLVAAHGCFKQSIPPGVPPSPDDIAIIMYTSGTTGVPKGVLITHRNMMGTMKAFSDAVILYYDDVFMGYLPLAHVLELLVESVCLLCGISIGYSTPLTMIDSSSKIKKGTKGDASVLRPTCLTAVPLILDRIYKGVYDKVSKGSDFTQALFYFAYKYKKVWMKRGFDTPLMNKLIFGQTRELMGGKLRMILSGGAPLSPDTHELIKICLCAQVMQGYGLTETCSCATVADSYDRSTGRVGAPTTVCDIKLVDWEEGNYRVTDKPFPRGEIIIGGDNVSPGYYKMPEKTKEDFFEENGRRWFKTGDIGEFHADGVIKIIDRKKDLVKLQLGEYVSLGKVEAELKTCPVVENICVYGDPTKQYTVALVVPNPADLMALGSKLGLSNLNFEQLCVNQTVEKAVLQEIGEHGKKCKLEKFEVPAAVKLCTEVWSPDMGLVTAAFKLKRKDIQDRYQHEINRMYAS
ncbi:fatty acid CoA ligase Acsl3-like isoform X3 [Periplaneta americana]|uniref:fatty acid CoA ligase Acsl3-like isoform X3 n=1 Tax=Periplaneta americana TaxID=6978 RepID=UPI0037E98AFC